MRVEKSSKDITDKAVFGKSSNTLQLHAVCVILTLGSRPLDQIERSLSERLCMVDLSVECRNSSFCFASFCYLSHQALVSPRAI